jgi:hypothetical protein
MGIPMSNGRPEPSEKSSGMTSFLEATTGRTTAIKELKCVKAPFGCGKNIEPGDMETWDRDTQIEYTISGMCKKCQDEVFSEPDFD